MGCKCYGIEKADIPNKYAEVINHVVILCTVLIIITVFNTFSFCLYYCVVIVNVNILLLTVYISTCYI